MHSYSDLTPKQLTAIEWLPYRTEAFVILPVGFGKTVIALTAIKEILDVYAATSANPNGHILPARNDDMEGQAHPGPNSRRADGGAPLLGISRPRTLVVSTKAICDHTWGPEIENWDHLTGQLTYASAAGRKEASVQARPDILGVNFESLEWLLDLADADPSLLPDMVVIDESSKMKDHKTGRVKRFAGFGANPRGYVHRFKRRWNLTATPTAEGFMGLYAQEACISMRRRLGQTITDFRNEYAERIGEREQGRYVIGKYARRAIMDKLAPITFTTPDDDYRGDRPEPIHSEVLVPWTDEGRAIYDEIEETLGADLTDFLETMGEDDDDLFGLTEEELAAQDIDVISAGSAAVLIQKLRQACAGFVYDGRGNARRIDDADAKLRALAALRERVGDAPILVFFQFRAEAEAIRNHFRDAVVGLPDSLDDWNNGRVPMLAVHPASAGHGVNLQYGAHVAAWFSLPYSYEQWHQGNGRLDRTGQPDQVSIVRFLRPNSVEQDIWTKLQSKGAGLKEFIHGMRERRLQS